MAIGRLVMVFLLALVLMGGAAAQDEEKAPPTAPIEEEAPPEGPSSATEETAPPTPTVPPTATPTPASRAGDILLADNFDDPSAGVMARSSETPTLFQYGYDGGEYVMRRISPEATGNVTVPLPGTFADSVIAVDARIVGETSQRLVALQCRRIGGPDQQQYRFEVSPDRGAYRLLRFIDGAMTPFPDWTPAPAIQRGNAVNRLELRCAGSTIAVRANGVSLVSAEDPALREGRLAITAGVLERRLLIEARFDNLVVSQP